MAFKVAVIGAGGMGGTHARCYSRISKAEVVGILDQRLDAAEDLAREVGCRAYGEMDALLSEAAPDVVDVCVPTPWHPEYVCKAASYGLRGIVVEKPMARTVADCDRMIAACAESGTLLFVAHVLRFFPEFTLARDRILEGAVGNVAAVRTRRGGPFPKAWENWYGKIAWSGGLLLDLVIHDFDWLRWTFGEVERVHAHGIAGTKPEDAEVEFDYALVTLRFRSGVIGHVEGTWADPGGFKVQFEIAGDAGLLESNFNQPTGAPYVAALVAQEGAKAGVAVPESPTATNPYQLELEHFLGCLETGAIPSVSPEDGREAVRIALAALESSRTGQPVILNGDSR